MNTDFTQQLLFGLGLQQNRLADDLSSILLLSFTALDQET